MKKSRLALIPFISGVLLTPVGAWAGPYDPPGAPSSNLGGGFIELLMTGQTQSPAQRNVIRQQLRSAPEPARAYWGNAGFHLSDQPEEDLQFIQRRPVGAPQQPQQQASLGTYPVQGEMDPIYRRQEVDYNGPHGAGTIVIDTPHKFLYLVQGNGRAMRYGIGVGRPGFTWAGVKTITRKAEWPGWTPPPEMIKRRPDLPRHMEGGPENPLGARAMYLGSTLYRIHGTNEPNTIGTNVSSGCIRLINDDVADLYGRVKVGTKVIVM